MHAEADSGVIVPGPGTPEPSVRQRTSHSLVIPGNAATAILGRDAQPAKVAKLEAELGLDEPVLTRFFHWAGKAIQLDFGNSLGEGQAVTQHEAAASHALITLKIGRDDDPLGAESEEDVFSSFAAEAPAVFDLAPDFSVAPSSEGDIPRTRSIDFPQTGGRPPRSGLSRRYLSSCDEAKIRTYVR